MLNRVEESRKSSLLVLRRFLFADVAADFDTITKTIVDKVHRLQSHIRIAFVSLSSISVEHHLILFKLLGTSMCSAKGSGLVMLIFDFIFVGLGVFLVHRDFPLREFLVCPLVEWLLSGTIVIKLDLIGRNHS